MKLLLADDERELSRAVEVILKHSGYEVECAYDGAQALEKAQEGDFDAYILDIMMPEMSGIEVLKELRENGDDSPVIMLTAKADLDDKIYGLDAGANDYITKPFAMGELLARIRAATRNLQEPSVIKYGNITLNRDTYEMSNDKSSFRLGNMEYEMMRMMIRAAEKEITCEQFIEKVWDGDGEPDEVVLYVSYLRKKLDALDADIVISKTVMDGYILQKKG